MKVTFDTTEFDRELQRLINRVDEKSLRAVTSYAATPLKNALVEKIPVVSGNLSESIGKKSRKYKDGGVLSAVIALVGARMGGRYKGYHAWLWDRGFKHWIGKRVRGANVFRPTTEAMAGVVKARMLKGLLKRIHGS